MIFGIHSFGGVGLRVGGVLSPESICAVSPVSGYKTPPSFQILLGEVGL
jgi:hypothetical protein